MKKLIAMVLALVMMLALGVTASAANNPPTKEEAKKIALEYAGVDESEAFFTKARTDRDDGRHVYEFEFYVDTTEYEVEVDANTGRVTDFSVDRHDGRRGGGFDSRRGYDDDWYDYDDRYDLDGRFDWDD